MWGYWVLAPHGIVFADREPGSNVYSFHLLSHGRSEPVRLATVDKPLIPGDSGAGISPDGKKIYYSQVDQSGSDVLMLENPVGSR
jgi:hypothetical protein